MSTPPSPNNLRSFEEQMARLEEIVALLDRGNLPLEQLLELYEEAVQLIAACRRYLENAEQRVIAIRSRAGEEAAKPSAEG